MIRFLKHRNGVPKTVPPLGPLENTVMEIIWNRGDCNVHDVIGSLDRPLAYTTVMTTLDRLFKKALLDRRKDELAFLYSPRLSRTGWAENRAGDLAAVLQPGPQHSCASLISCLRHTVIQHT